MATKQDHRRLGSENTTKRRGCCDRQLIKKRRRRVQDVDQDKVETCSTSYSRIVKTFRSAKPRPLDSVIAGYSVLVILFTTVTPGASSLSTGHGARPNRTTVTPGGSSSSSYVFHRAWDRSGLLVSEKSHEALLRQYERNLAAAAVQRQQDVAENVTRPSRAFTEIAQRDNDVDEFSASSLPSRQQTKLRNFEGHYYRQKPRCKRMHSLGLS